MERSAAHRHGDVKSARADCYHSDSASRGRVAVRAEERLSRLAEAFEMDLVADSVARAGEVKPVLRRDRLEVAVVVHVLEVSLERVVVDVRDGKLRLHARNPDCLELEVRHRTRRVLGERLVDFQRDVLPARDGVPLPEIDVGTSFGNDVLLNDFLGKCESHF